MKPSELIINNQYEFYDYIGLSKFHNRYKCKKFSWIRYKDQYRDYSFYPGDALYNINPENDSDIEDIINKIKFREIPSAVWIEEIDHNKKVIEALDRNDFKVSFKSIAMYLRIDDMNDININDKKNEIQIKLVDSDELLKQWVNILIEGWWTWNKGNEMNLYNLYKDIYTNNDKIRLYLAFFKGRPAGTALCFLDNNSVGLYLISTHPDYRGKGIGKMLTKTPITEAYKDGYRDAVLHGTEMGEVIYKQLGFKEHFRTSSYFLPLEKMK